MTEIKSRLSDTDSNNNNSILKDEKIKLIAFFSYLGILVLGGFGLYNLIILKNTLSGVVELGAGIIVVINFILLKRFESKWIYKSIHIILFFLGIPLVVLLLTGGIEGTGIYWVSIFPITAFLLAGRKFGIIWSLFFSLIVMFLFILSALGFVRFFYSHIELRQLAVSLTIITALVYYFSTTKERAQQMAANQAKKYFEVNENMKRSLIESEKNRQILKLQSEDLEKNKKATLNILEDLNSEKIKAEEARIKSESLIASIGDGLIATDEKGRIVVVNQSALDMLGFDREDLIGQWMPKVIKVQDNKGVLIPREALPITESLTSGEVVSANANYIRKNGTSFPVAITVSPVIANEKPLGAIDVFRDITHEMEVDRMKTEFISLASHQLRTPLSAMKWFLEMLISGDAGELSGEQKEMIVNIDQSNERMIALVNSLLNVSRIESGRIIIEPTPTDLRELINDVQTDLKAKLEEKKQQFIVSVNDDLPKINIDPKLIRQVYLNLLTNAIKYTPEGGEISVFVSKKEDQVISQVTDTGYGIPAKDHDKVFKKFYRGDNIIKIETDGNGLGMYLVKSIVDSSGGKIWFESKTKEDAASDTVKSGTTFWFSLPFSGMVAKKGEVSID